MERLLQRAREVAAKALAEDRRGNGAPMYEHAKAVALIVADEIGLPETCIAAVYLHEATRFHPEVDISEFPEDVKILVDGLNKIAKIRPKDTRL